jgi:hypothetical protein
MKSPNDKIEAFADAIHAEHDVIVRQLRGTITALPCVPVMQTAAMMALAEVAAMVIVSLQDLNPAARWRELFDERVDQRLALFADDDAKKGQL